MSKKKIIGFVAAAVVVGSIAASCAGGGSSYHQNTPTAPSQRHTAPVSDVRKDLISLKFDDRSQSGVNDVYTTWTIKNHSSKKSDYSFGYDVVQNSTGQRVDHQTQLEVAVSPGQTAVGSYPTINQQGVAGYSIHLTDFSRSMSAQ